MFASVKHASLLHWNNIDLKILCLWHKQIL